METSGNIFFFFAAGAFVDDTIWIRNGQALTQYILDIASKFFEINDIFIHNDKTMAVFINQRVVDVSLSINGKPIFVLGHIFVYGGFFKPSLAKIHGDVRFFLNMVLKKVISNKQFSYLVSAVLQPIISYHMQFSFIAMSVKELRSKAILPRDFPNETLHHLLLYGLKSFEQVQAETKVASMVSFSNASEILSHLFEYCTLDLQISGWVLLHSLSYSVKLRVCLLDNFLAGVVRILIDVNISLSNNIPNAFHQFGHAPISEILGSNFYFDVVPSLKYFSVVFGNILLNKHGHSLVPNWFTKVFVYMSNHISESGRDVAVVDCSDFFCLSEFLNAHECLYKIWVRELNIFTNNSLNGLQVILFSDIGLGVGVNVQDLLSSTLVKLQTIALALECVPSACSVVLYSNSQTALTACALECELDQPDFQN
ncbi:hypothetical protein G9A89_014210 [Geosiphon pyriformis]|nr:hypothetical protein G9A89_014210 [Geosiphon pyriformis]